MTQRQKSRLTITLLKRLPKFGILVGKSLTNDRIRLKYHK